MISLFWCNVKPLIISILEDFIIDDYCQNDQLQNFSMFFFALTYLIILKKFKSYMETPLIFWKGGRKWDEIWQIYPDYLSLWVNVPRYFMREWNWYFWGFSWFPLNCRARKWPEFSLLFCFPLFYLNLSILHSIDFQSDPLTQEFFKFLSKLVHTTADFSIIWHHWHDILLGLIITVILFLIIA